MTERGRDNARIATKVFIFFVVPLALLFLLHVFGVAPESRQPGMELFPATPSITEQIFSGLYFVLLFVTFVLPLLVLRKELQKRRTRK